MHISKSGKLTNIKMGSRILALMEVKGHLVLMDAREAGTPLRYKKGSLTFRMGKGMKIKAAIKDLITKGKAASTEAILIDMG